MGIGSWFLVVKRSCLELTFLFTNLELNSPYNYKYKENMFFIYKPPKGISYS